MSDFKFFFSIFDVFFADFQNFMTFSFIKKNININHATYYRHHPAKKSNIEKNPTEIEILSVCQSIDQPNRASDLRDGQAIYSLLSNIRICTIWLFSLSQQFLFNLPPILSIRNVIFR